MAKNEVRIIGGKWRGRKLKFPPIAGLRPSADRTRETLFNWLSAQTAGARCLDLFAGSGALGFEAASRHAASVDLVEQNTHAAGALDRSKLLLGADSVQVHCQDAFGYLRRARPGYDLVFIDPPFETALARETLNWLAGAEPGLLTPQALVYVEISKSTELALPTTHWQVHRDKDFGDSKALLLRPGSSGV
jgi:16S rRNA (guanine966-N2)-methyltransferase